jgi:uncharacterized protein YbjT (DUF2867 family)
MVRSFGFMSNTLRWVPQLAAGDLVRAPFAGVAVAMIDPYDIAAVAAAALTSGAHEGRVCTVSGPEPLRPADRARILGEVLGRDLRFEGQPDDEARAEMSASMPAEYVDAFFDFYVAGTLDESQPQPDVRDVTGREPRTFRQWAQAHAGAFKPPGDTCERSDTQARCGARLPEKIVVNPGSAVDPVHHRPPNSPRSPNQPRKGNDQSY